jgi:rhodanese-related sulfurtransferase
MNGKLGLSLILFASLLLVAVGLSVGGPQTKCPVMGGKINPELYADVEGHRIYVCCQGCIATVKADPAKYLAKIKANGEEAATLCKCGEVKGSAECKAAAKAKDGSTCAAHRGKGNAECKASCGTCPVAAKLTAAKAEVSADCPDGACAATVKAKAKPAASAKVPTLETSALAALIQAKTPLVLLDARSGKWDDGRRLPGAKQLHPKATEAEAAKLIPAKDSLVVTYCSNVKCQASPQLAKRLRGYGYTNVIEYPQGIDGWVEAGHPVTKPEAEKAKE